MSFLSPKPFRGYTLRDVLQYLQVDATKAFADLFAILGKIKLEERYLSIGTDQYASFGATATAEDVASLTLDQGEWSVWGSVMFKPNGAAGTLSGDAWLGLLSASSSGTTRGQSRTQVQLASVTPEQGAMVFRRVILPKRQTVYLGARASFSGGAVQRLGSIWAIGRV